MSYRLGIEMRNVIFCLMATFLLFAAQGHARILIDEPETVAGIAVFRDSDENGQCYYMPEPRVAKRSGGKEELEFLEYVKTEQDGSHIMGGSLQFAMELGLEGTTTRELRRKAGETGLECETLGPVPFTAGEFRVGVAELKEGHVFTRGVVGEGSAPLLPNHRIPVSVALSPEGATFIKRAMQNTDYRVYVNFEMTYEGLTESYKAKAAIDMEQLQKVFEQQSMLLSALVNSRKVWYLPQDQGAQSNDDQVQASVKGELALPECDDKPVLYKKKNFKGKKYGIQESTPALNVVNFNNKARSICVPSGVKITLYDRRDYGGNSLEIVGPERYRDLKDFPRGGQHWKNDTSSVKVEYLGRDDSEAGTPLQKVLETSGAVKIVEEGSDENLGAILQIVTERLVAMFTEDMSGSDLVGAGGEDDETRTLNIRRVEQSKSFTMELEGRQSAERVAVLSADIGESIGSEGEEYWSHRLIDLDDPDFQMRTVEVGLDIESLDSFGKFINYATVVLRKTYQDSSRDSKQTELSFNRKTVEENGNSLSWTYPLLGEDPADGGLGYDYKVVWNFAGGVKMETGWQSTDVSPLAISPPLQPRSIDLAIDKTNAEEHNVRFVRVLLEHDVAGQKRSEEVKLQPDNEQWVTHRYYHEPGNRQLRYKVEWYVEGEWKSNGWQRSNHPFIDLNYVPQAT